MNVPSRSIPLVACVVLVATGCRDDVSRPVAHGASDVPRLDGASDTFMASDGASEMDTPLDLSDAPLATDTTVADDGLSEVPAAHDGGGDGAIDRAMMTAVGPYPPGPYGRDEGQILANLAWEGYSNPEGVEVSTARPFAPISMQAIRETGRSYAMVHLSEFF